jgi:hypothetical protein|tara:strand:- start:450 stop:728 length:279 start_codon:yes stop_codon:yes gene_type:complete
MTVTMKGLAGFMFFMLFLAGLALVNLRGMQDQSVVTVPSDEELADTAYEHSFLESLPMVHIATLSDTQLILKDSSGNILSRFVSAPLAAIAN